MSDPNAKAYDTVSEAFENQGKGQHVYELDVAPDTVKFAAATGKVAAMEAVTNCTRLSQSQLLNALRNERAKEAASK